MTPLLLTLLLSVSPATHAEAERLAKQSITDYNVGDFQAALDEATRAYKLEPRPALLYNLGQVHRALHHWEQAEFYYRGYLRGKPDAPNRVAVEKLIDEMQAKQAAPASTGPTPTPTITVTPKPAPPAPTTPTQVPVVIENQPEAQPQPAPGAPLAAPPATTEQQPRTIMAAEPGSNNQAEASAPVTKTHTAAYVLGGISIAAAGFGIASWVEYDQYYTWFKQATAVPPTPGVPPMSTNSAQIWYVSAIVLSAVTAAGLTGAIIVW